MNPILLQKQIRENAADLQDFCKDLKSWGEEMKRKESSISNNNVGDGDKNPVKKVPKLDKGKATKKHSSKIGATDYDYWSKFDADAECDKIDGDLDDDSELTDEIDETLRDQALLEKEKGNKFVKNQKWDEAIQSYTKAIDFYSFDPIFYANRALCYLKKNEYEKAIEDCTKSLRLDSTYVKAYQRRAAAHEALEKMDLAEHDLLKVLEYEPNNKESKLLLNKIRKKDIDKNQRPVSKFTASRNIGITPVPSKPSTVPTIDPPTVKDSVSIWPEDDNIVSVKSIKKPPHSRSKKPLKRIDIIETDNSAKIVEVEPVKKHVVIKESPEIITEEPAKTVSAFKQKRMEKNVVAEQKKAQFPKPDKPDIKTDDMKIVERKCVSYNEDEKELKNSSNLTIRKEEERTEEVLVAPKNYVQFNNSWRNHRTTRDRYKYLKIINPEDFPKIFQESLEANTFSGILQTLAQHFIENNDPVYNYLLSLTKVKRFCTFTMFMEAEDKRNVWKLLDYIKEQKERPKEDVDNLVAQYEL